MKKLKRIVSKIFIFVMCLMLFTGCDKSTNQSKTDKITVVCTMFSQYDWAKQIIGDNENVELILLGDTGVDMHSFQPTADDIITISECDVFIYVGGVSDSWVNDALEQAKNEDMIVVNMMGVLGDNLKQEEHVEGMEEHEHDEDEHDDAHSEHDNLAEYDEHVWLSVKNATIICDAIADAMCKVDLDNSSEYKSNLEEYKIKLNELDVAYQTAVDEGANKTILFADRFPYIYLMKDYSIEYYAAFAGCSADTEASFETVAFLAGKIDELNLSVVLIEKGSSQDLAKTIINSTTSKAQAIMEMNSIQAVTKEQLEAGETYISIMQSNLEVLKQALN